MVKTYKVPRKLSMVKFDFADLPKKYHKCYPFKEGNAYLFLGEIVNMPGHCAVVDNDGIVKVGFHTEDFIELTVYET